MDNKQRERRVLALVYEEDEYAELLDSEEQGFRIKPHSYLG